MAALFHQVEEYLVERLQNPHVRSAAVSGAVNIYKIKLRRGGYRLVYSVEDRTVIVTVIAVGKRGRNEVYDVALSRLEQALAPHPVDVEESLQQARRLRERYTGPPLTLDDIEAAIDQGRR